MKSIFVIALALTTLFAACSKEIDEAEENFGEVEEFNFGPNPGD